MASTTRKLAGTVGGKADSFLLMDFGTLAANKVEGTSTVVSGSGTGALAGVEGRGPSAPPSPST